MGQQATPRTPLLRRASSRFGSTPATPDQSSTLSSSQTPQAAAAAAAGGNDSTTPAHPAPSSHGAAQLSSAPVSTPAAGEVQKVPTPSRRRFASHDGGRPAKDLRNENGPGKGVRSLFQQASAPVWPPQVFHPITSLMPG